MRFLILVLPKHPMPPDPNIPEANLGWLDQHKSKLEQAWSFAGIAGGGAIVNVDSAEELDSMMMDFPFGPFSEVSVYALADLDQAMQQLKEVLQQMSGQGGQR
jgi:muconolactone delta-isomerase